MDEPGQAVSLPRTADLKGEIMFSSRPRVCFLTTSYPDFPGGYRGLFVRRVAQGLVERGYEISVVTPRMLRRSKQFEAYGAERIYRFPFLSEDKLLVEYDRVPVVRMVTFMVSGLLSCVRVSQKERCQLIHAHFVIPTGLIGVLVGRWLKIPVIIQAHGSDLTQYARLNRWMGWLSAFTAKQADHILVVSDELRTILTKKFAVSTEKITVRSCGIDLQRFRPVPRDLARDRLGLSRQASIVLSVGELIPRKGFEVLMSAIARIVKHDSNLQLVVVGEGPLREQLLALAHDLAVEKVVHFVGSRPNEEMPLWYSAADIFVLPSRREGTPLALLEALSCGVPVVVSRAGGMSQVIEHGKNGLLVDIADPVDLENKLGLLLGDLHLRQRFKETARDTVLSWAGIQDEIDIIEHLYRNLGLAATLTKKAS